MNRIRMIAVVLALFACGAAAGAIEKTSDLVRRDAPKGISETFYACIDKADYGTIAIAACLTAEKHVQDARLNRSYKALLGKLDGKGREQLVDAERAWLAFRGKSGGLESTLWGSEIVSNLEVAQRDMFRVCERANTLDDYLSLVSDM
ncbi:lysozyme inhibitor LprI family protein [Frateuria hangzhouensis]|uniref:lysozyme inhibitor LprI family protein n=1 Tax=Frateuria hangzhouensis TaxID=2995589 RepID=UPI002260CBC0|nr:lysozyme inhibitor LprI family protein [Frateuria sp. STR12]MCX7514739.1 lysozyme inhibitor LprI family protein [Frateuria sp. STR12]